MHIENEKQDLPWRVSLRIPSLLSYNIYLSLVLVSKSCLMLLLFHIGGGFFFVVLCFWISSVQSLRTSISFTSPWSFLKQHYGSQPGHVSFCTINSPHLIKNPGFPVRSLYLQQQAPSKTPRIGNMVLKYIAQ